ncbi:MAG: cohesin domain-containing protein, partial [Candidatus Cloacimonadota bacterium]|nr:cohesin domain-containing protein [Candidatus Cloacimonadota bacterium]
YDTSLILQWGVEIINEFPIELGEETVLAFGELSMEDMQVEAGNSISVPLYLENGYDIFSFEFDLLFDNSSLEFTGIRKGENINNFQVLHSQNENALKIVGANAYEDGETGVFLELLFNVPANYNESSTEVVLSRMRFNENEFIEDSTSAILTYAPPNSPANVQIQIINNNTYLTWDIVNRATKYHVYRSANPENGFFRITPYPAGISETSFIDTESGDKYFYYITAE